MIINRRLHLRLLFFSFFFIFIFCIGCCLADKFLGFWVFFELCSLCLVPSFFFVPQSSLYKFYSCLLSYIIMSGLSSVFIVTGILFSEFYIFIFLGFLIKFGLFPFSFWVYWVFSEANWFFIFLLSVIMKFPMLFFCFLYTKSWLSLVYFDCSLTMLVCSVLFWGFRFKWKYIWGHISLSSVSTLVVCCFCSDSIVCYFIYGYYFFWSVCSIWYFYISENNDRFNDTFWLFCIFLLITPLSIPLLYKLFTAYGLLFSSLYVLLSWCIYSLSEQFFLYKCSRSLFYSRVYKGWSN